MDSSIKNSMNISLGKHSLIVGMFVFNPYSCLSRVYYPNKIGGSKGKLTIKNLVVHGTPLSKLG